MLRLKPLLTTLVATGILIGALVVVFPSASAASLNVGIGQGLNSNYEFTVNSILNIPAGERLPLDSFEASITVGGQSCTVTVGSGLTVNGLSSLPTSAYGYGLLNGYSSGGGGYGYGYGYGSATEAIQITISYVGSLNAAQCLPVKQVFAGNTGSTNETATI